MAFVNTQFAAGAAMTGWAATSYWRTRRVTLLDMCMGAVTGMVAMTPAAADVTPVWATVIGFPAGLSCAFAVSWKYRLGVDDTLDAVGIHGWGGLFGMLMTGLAATGVVTGKKGLFYGGSWNLLGNQLVAVLALGLFSFVMTAVIGKVIDLTVGLRQPGSIVEHEQAYDTDVASQLQDVADALGGPRPTADKNDAGQLIDRLRVLLARVSRADAGVPGAVARRLSSGSPGRSAVDVDGMAVGAFRFPGQQWKKTLCHGCDRVGTRGGVVGCPVGPQLRHPDRVRVLRRGVDAVGQQAAVVAAGPEPLVEQGDQLVAPSGQRGHPTVDAEHVRIGHAFIPPAGSVRAQPTHRAVLRC
jgi:hypothetical protein